MNVDELIVNIEVEQEAAIKKRDKAKREVDVILGVAQQEGRSNLTQEEGDRIDVLFAAQEAAKKDLVGIASKLETAQRSKREEVEADKQAREVKPTGARKPSYDEVARVGQEERTYHKGNDARGGQFLRDIARQYLYQDPQAAGRLSRHMHEERVERETQITRAAGDTLTTNWSGLVVPQYLTELYAPATAALRPFADICNQHPLPADGMSVEISRVTTASSVALQSTQLTAVSATSMDDTLLTIPVKTAAGQQTMSRQAIDRGTGIEDIVLQDLFNRYATALDSTLLTEGTTGLSAVAQANAYTDTTASGAELYPKLLGAASAVETNMLAMGAPSHAVMHSRRWYWLSSQLTSTWPMIAQPSIPTQAIGTNNATAYAQGVRGVLPNGLLVIVDNNIAVNGGAGTNEDEIYVVPNNECHLWEDPSAPVFIRAEQPSAANLGVVLVVYGYFAYTFGRYANAMQKVAGTGLTTPSF